MSDIFFIKNQHVKVVLLENTMTHKFQKTYNKDLVQLRSNDSCKTCDKSLKNGQINDDTENILEKEKYKKKQK